MTLDDIEEQLPWGLHDALLLRLSVDWTRAELMLEVRVMITERQDMDQLARILVTGLVFCTIDPPEIDPSRGYVSTCKAGLRLDAGPGPAPGASLPAIPKGCFLHWIFVREWNRFLRVARATPTKVGASAVARQSWSGPLFEGEAKPSRRTRRSPREREGGRCSLATRCRADRTGS